MSIEYFSENWKIDETIKYCFQFISENDVQNFIHKFRKQPHQHIQIMHTFHELVLGAFLAQNHLRVRNEYRIENQTPDWVVIDADSSPICIVELTNYHADAETTAEIHKQIQEKGIWCGFVKPNTKRLYDSIWEKASKYKVISNNNILSYVVSVFGDFSAVVDQSEIDDCLFDTETGIYKQYPELSGVLYFEENFGSYHFVYRPNPNAYRKISLPDGKFH